MISRTLAIVPTLDDTRTDQPVMRAKRLSGSTVCTPLGFGDRRPRIGQERGQ